MKNLFTTKLNHTLEPKRSIFVRGMLTHVLRPGFPAVYLYRGNLIKTTAVQAILEANEDHVRFETENSIYTISYLSNTPDSNLSA